MLTSACQKAGYRLHIECSNHSSLTNAARHNTGDKMNILHLDRALEDALKMSAETNFEHLQRTIRVSNLKQWYTEHQMFWPALDAKQREVFNECEREALEIGIER